MELRINRTYLWDFQGMSGKEEVEGILIYGGLFLARI